MSWAQTAVQGTGGRRYVRAAAVQQKPSRPLATEILFANLANSSGVIMLLGLTLPR